MLSIDLLTKFADDLQFEYDLIRAEDPKWGVLGRDGKWNGLMAGIVDRHFDVALTSLKASKKYSIVLLYYILIYIL